MKAKQELNAIKNLDEKSKISELNVANLLENSWEQYYLCQIFKENNMVHLQLCVRNRHSNKNINITRADIDRQEQCFYQRR